MVTAASLSAFTIPRRRHSFLPTRILRASPSQCSSSAIPASCPSRVIGKATIGVYDPKTAMFFVRNSNSAGPPDAAFEFGEQSQIPVAGDWDGDGKASVGVYVASRGAFMLRNALTAGPADTVVNLGNVSSRPIAGAW